MSLKEFESGWHKAGEVVKQGWLQHKETEAKLEGDALRGYREAMGWYGESSKDESQMLARY